MTLSKVQRAAISKRMKRYWATRRASSVRHPRKRSKSASSRLVDHTPPPVQVTKFRLSAIVSVDELASVLTVLPDRTLVELVR